MDGSTRDFPPGDMRVSDADRDRAVSGLSAAYQAGRLTKEEFDQRSAQALRAVTGSELTALFADLPPDHVPATQARIAGPARRGAGVIAARVAMGASGAAAVSLGFLALANGLSAGSAPSAPSPAKIAIAREILAGQGIKVDIPSHIPTPPAPGFDWVGTLTPAVIAVVLVVVIVVLNSTLRSAWANRAQPRNP